MTEFAPTDLRPSEVESYLASHQWERVRDVDHGSIWIVDATSGERFDVFVPHEPEFSDYDRRLAELIQTISDHEQRPVPSVLRDLVEAVSDVIRFRLPFAFADDSVPFDDAMKLFQRARDALRAAALSTVEARPVHASGTPHQVDAFLHGIRLGQTERGSFVVPVIAPLGTVEAGTDEVVPRSDEPFGRFVTRELASALGAVDDATQLARSSDDLSPFLAAVPAGVSANLCTAMSEMTDALRSTSDATDRAVAIHFSWSPTRPIGANVRSSFAISREDAALLSDAASFLRTVTPRPRVTVTGYVVKLEREEDQADGSIGIKGMIDDAERTVVVRLSPDDYAKALRAHDLRLSVTCSGVLQRKGNYSSLDEPIEFEAPEALF